MSVCMCISVLSECWPVTLSLLISISMCVSIKFCGIRSSYFAVSLIEGVLVLVYSSVCLHVCLSVCLSVHVCKCENVYLSVVSLYLHASVDLFISSSSSSDSTHSIHPSTAVPSLVLSTSSLLPPLLFPPMPLLSMPPRPSLSRSYSPNSSAYRSSTAGPLLWLGLPVTLVLLPPVNSTAHGQRTISP